MQLKYGSNRVKPEWQSHLVTTMDWIPRVIRVCCGLAFCQVRNICFCWKGNVEKGTNMVFIWLCQWRKGNQNTVLNKACDQKESKCLWTAYKLVIRDCWRRQWHPTAVLLPGKSHGWRSLVGCSPWDRKESDTTEQLHFHFSLSCIGEGNGNPLQYSCLENPRDRGAWWAPDYGVAPSRTWLKRYSSNSRDCFHTFWIVLLINLPYSITGWIKQENVCLLLLFSHQVLSDSSQPHGLQHPRLPCPSPSPGICPSSCPLHWWMPSSLPIT